MRLRLLILAAVAALTLAQPAVAQDVLLPQPMPAAQPTSAPAYVWRGNDNTADRRLIAVDAKDIITIGPDSGSVTMSSDGAVQWWGASKVAAKESTAVAPPRNDVDDWKMHLALSVSMASEGADLATTFEALGRQHECERLLGSASKKFCPGFREANPLLKPFANDSFTFGTVKMGVAALSQWAHWRLHKTHPRAARAYAWGNAALKFWVASRNARLVR